jgi:hypothetical protein
VLLITAKPKTINLNSPMEINEAKIAGDDNDEAGGQQGIKVRDSLLKKSKIKSNSSHSEAQEAPDEIEG